MTTPIQPSAAVPASSAAQNTYTDVNALAALKKDPNSPQAIKAVAQQVDALFLQMMLKSMRDASSDTGEPASNEMSMYQDMFDKQIALQLSQRGGLGIGTQLTRQLAAQASAATAKGAGAKEAAGTIGAAPAIAAPAKTALAPDSSAADDGAGTAKSEPPPASPPTSMLEDAIHFVGAVLPTIQRAAEALGVSPVGMLAQAALETGWGKRMPHTADGAPSMNMFGIKADDNWTGARASASTVEFSGGVATQRHSAFRAYGSIEDSVSDFANLLQTSPRYRNAVAVGGNVQAYIKGIGDSGYATDPHYANKLNEMVNSSTFRTALIVAKTIKL
jgi:peptidoglycan hydrolase FlgJ